MILIVTSLVLVVAWSVLIEWEWSFVDDAGQKTALADATSRAGLLPGVLDHIESQARADWAGWGLFRPVYYVYAGLFYLTTPAVAHGIRLGMLLAVVLIPAYRFAKREGTHADLPLFIWATCLFLANTTVYQGLTFLSLQELTGLALVAAGLATSNSWGRSLLWLAAAWMKTPFVWLFLAWGLWLVLKRGNRLVGAAVIATAVATVVAAAVSARAGTYSSNFVISAAQIQMSVRTAIPLFYWPGLIGALGLIALRPQLRSIAWRDPLALVLAAGGLLYLANLLPWGRIGVYYGAPAIWMLSAAAVRFVATAELRRWSGNWRVVTAATMVITIAATGYLVTKILRLQYQRNEAVVNVRDFALSLRDEDPVIGINGSEAALRLHQIVLLRDSRWRGEIVFVDAADATAAPDYYVALTDELVANPRLARNPIKSWPAATIYDP